MIDIINEFIEAEKSTNIRTGGWNVRVTPKLFAKWDKSNKQKLEKVMRNYVLKTTEDAATYERYLYKPTKEGWFLNFASKVKQNFEDHKEEFEKILQDFTSQKDLVKIEDIYNRYRQLTRAKHADWMGGVYCCVDKDFYSYVFASPEEVKKDLIDSYDLATEAFLITKTYEKKHWNLWNSTDEEASDAFRRLLKKIRALFVSKVSSRWEEYKPILSARDITDEKAFTWMLNRMIEDKISYYQRTHTVEDFLQNFEKMLDAGIKEIVLYIEAVRDALAVKGGFESSEEYQSFKSEEDIVFFNRLRGSEKRGNLWD